MFSFFGNEKRNRFKFKKDYAVDLGTFMSRSGVSVYLSYGFSGGRRKASFRDGRYGSSIGFARLYDFLSRVYNNGAPFLDRYFESLPKSNIGDSVRRMVNSLNNSLKNEMDEIVQQQVLTKKGLFHKGRKQYKRLKEFKTFYAESIEDLAKDIEEKIRKDVVRKLANGKIVMDKKSVTMQTIRIRERLGLDTDPSHVFYASAQLAGAIEVTFNIEVEEEQIGV
jgi:hypothetical protein